MSPAEVTNVEGWAKPIPQPDNVNRDYWAACARGELMVQECPDCGAGSSTRVRCAQPAVASLGG